MHATDERSGQCNQVKGMGHPPKNATTQLMLLQGQLNETDD
jgi:hypothetical protein